MRTDKEIFARLHNPESLIQNTTRFFVEMKVTGSTRPPQQADEIPVRIPLPFKDQRSASKLREQLSDLSRKINTEVHPVFTSHKIKDELKAKEPKPPIVNQQNVVYFFKCDLCDADYVDLIFEMFFIRDLKPKLNKQSDSIRAKLFA